MPYAKKQTKLIVHRGKDCIYYAESIESENVKKRWNINGYCLKMDGNIQEKGCRNCSDFAITPSDENEEKLIKEKKRRRKTT